MNLWATCGGNLCGTQGRMRIISLLAFDEKDIDEFSKDDIGMSIKK